MALLMVHLLAARKWAESIKRYEDCPEFYLGAISPDAMHIRYHDDKSRKDWFHLGNWLSPHPEQVAAYWREHFTPFDAGYGIHVLTDAQWVPRFRRLCPELLLPNGKLDSRQYYHDTVCTDFALLQEIPQARFLLQTLKTAVPPQDHPLLTAEEIGQWRDQTMEFYQAGCKCNAPAKSITPEYALNFLDACQPMLLEIARRYLQ